MALVKLQANIDEALIKQVDEYAASLHVNRTSAVSVLLSTALNQVKSMDVLQELLTVYKEQQKEQD